MIKNALIAALLMGIAGCATAAPPTSSVFGCAPEGYTNLQGWTMRDLRTGMAEKTDTGIPKEITSIGLSNGTRSMLMVFVGGELVLIDPDPSDRDVPILVNTRHVDANDLLKSEPSGACAWRPLLNGETA